ncbi:MAG: hypothetical protein AAF569_03535 [Pseudomonadota bacterium]
MDIDTEMIRIDHSGSALTREWCVTICDIETGKINFAYNERSLAEETPDLNDDLRIQLLQELKRRNTFANGCKAA